jgi:hypothetical protein
MAAPAAAYGRLDDLAGASDAYRRICYMKGVSAGLFADEVVFCCRKNSERQRMAN